MTAEVPRLPGVVGHRPALAARYRERGYWAGLTIGAEVDRWAEDYGDRKSTRLNSSHIQKSRMPSSA